MNICIVGGGHIGSTLACYIKHSAPEHKISLLTRHPEKFAESIICNDFENKITYSEKIDLITSSAELSVSDADVVYLALPSFAIEDSYKKISPYVKSGCMICAMPGCGGCEFIFSKYFDSSVGLFGFQRVPFTAKVVTYGKETNLKSWKPCVVTGALRKSDLNKACEIVRRCKLNPKPAPNYLSITLTPTNPVLHTSRMYDFLCEKSRDYVFEKREKFYIGWTNRASQTLISIDNELHTLINKMSSEFDLSAIKPLTEHYESYTVCDMTKKLSGIPTFQTVYAPMKEVKNGYIMDTSTRMFTEDFPWGLIIIKGFCVIYDIQTPTIDKVLNWYCEYMDKEYFVDGKLCGKDLCDTGIPQNFGLKTPEDVLSFYNGF